MSSSHAITKADATALWHAVEGLADLCRAMKGMPDMAEKLPQELARLAAARQALRKVQALARAGRKRRATESAPA